MCELISNTNTKTKAVGAALDTTTSAHVKTFNGRGGNIPDGRGTFIDDIIVKDDFRVTDVTVTLYDFVHTWVGDLVVQLRHLETQTVVDLFRRPGQPQFSSSGFSHDLNGDYSFNDHNSCDFEAAAGQNAVMPSGNYASTGSLKEFYTLPAAGTWRLTINDFSPGDSGSLGSWELNLGWG
ncbi:MAG TPA: proprotein convertase P-domain-containing protein [Coleofasciculaceae cyanobacterium]